MALVSVLPLFSKSCMHKSLIISTHNLQAASGTIPNLGLCRPRKSVTPSLSMSLSTAVSDDHGVQRRVGGFHSNIWEDDSIQSLSTPYGCLTEKHMHRRDILDHTRLLEEYFFQGNPSQLHDEFKEGVASKDMVIDPQTGVFICLYLPLLDGKGKVPVLLYVHGGGFCIESAASPFYHSYLNKVAMEAKVICASVEYRRAPEHRLPVAYDDYFGVLEWLDCQAMALEGVAVDPWLASHADFSNVFLVGDSARANIVHHVGILVSGRNWDGLSLQGAILVHPGFAIEERIGRELGTGAEVQGFNKLTDVIWSISLPVGADRDHPFCNPVVPHYLALSTLVYPRTLVFVVERDLIRDRGILYYEELKKAGKDVDFNIYV